MPGPGCVGTLQYQMSGGEKDSGQGERGLYLGLQYICMGSSPGWKGFQRDGHLDLEQDVKKVKKDLDFSEKYSIFVVEKKKDIISS